MSCVETSGDSDAPTHLGCHRISLLFFSRVVWLVVSISWCGGLCCVYWVWAGKCGSKDGVTSYPFQLRPPTLRSGAPHHPRTEFLCCFFDGSVVLAGYGLVCGGGEEQYERSCQALPNTCQLPPSVRRLVGMKVPEPQITPYPKDYSGTDQMPNIDSCMQCNLRYRSPDGDPYFFAVFLGLRPSQPLIGQRSHLVGTPENMTVRNILKTKPYLNPRFKHKGTSSQE